MQGEWLRLGDAAKRLGISPYTLRRRIKAGKVQAKQQPTRQGYEYLVFLEADATPDPLDIKPERTELQVLAELVQQQSQRIEQLSAEVGYWRGRYEERESPKLLVAPEPAGDQEESRSRPWWKFWGLGS